MTVVEQLDEAIGLLERQGIEVRVEYLDEIPGGLCRVGEKARVYLDLASSPLDQLETVMEVLSDLNSASEQTTNPEDQSRRAA